MMIRRLAAASLAFALAACGGSDDDTTPPRTVAVFTDPAYVDYDSATPPATGSEASNLVVTIDAAGFNAREFTGTTTAEWQAAMAGAAALAIPELENGDLNPDLDDATRAAIYDFVNGGGNLLLFWTDSSALAIVNATFGFSLSEGSGPVGTIAFQAADAAGTPYAGGPATLIDANATDTLSTAGLPAGAKLIYTDDNGEPVVTVIPYGLGHIVLHGYDWYNAAPNGTQDGGWLDALASGIRL